MSDLPLPYLQSLGPPLDAKAPVSVPVRIVEIEALGVSGYGKLLVRFSILPRNAPSDTFRPMRLILMVLPTNGTICSALAERPAPKCGFNEVPISDVPGNVLDLAASIAQQHRPK